MSAAKAGTSLLKDKGSIFKYSTISNNDNESLDLDDNDALEMTRIPVRRKLNKDEIDDEVRPKTTIGNKDSNTVVIAEDILPNDTLQSFSLRYGCSVNDIKRANGLITEQDFYALKRLKIRVNRYSLLTIPEEKRRHRQEHNQFYSNSSSRSSRTLLDTNFESAAKASFETILPSQLLVVPGAPQSSEFDSSESLDEASPLLVASSSNHESADDANDANKYLKKLDKDIRKTVKKADMKNSRSSHHESLNEVLSSIQYAPMQEMAPPSKHSVRTNGADCGMKWWVIILCFFVILAIIIALAIFEYYHSE